MISNLKKINRFFEGLNRGSLFALAAFLECILGWADYLTGTSASFRLYYLLPIFASTWYLGKKEGVVFSLISAVLESYGFYAEIPPGTSIRLLIYNLTEEGALFSLFSLLVFRIRIQHLKRIEEKQDLQKTISLLNATVESTADGILVVDKDGKTVFLFNDQFLNMWHIPSALVQEIKETKNDRPLLTYVTSQLRDPAGFFSKVKELYNHPEAESFDTLELTDGRIFERYSKPQMLNGEFYGRVWSFRDVTDKKKAEEELLKSMKLESIGLLAGGIAHDFNNILTAILGNISLARMDLDSDLSSYRYLSETEKATFRAKELATQLLSFAKGGAPQKTAVSIGPLLRDSTMFALRGSNVRPKFCFPENLWPAEIDSGQITQLVHNLVINGKQAMPAGGEMMISAENIVLDEREAMNVSAKPGSFVLISFKDTGEGIPENLISKIFDPFFTTKEGGSGLGLFSAYSIARNHDGTISVESRMGSGTTFFVYLPAAKDKIIQEESNKEETATGSGKILLMDDDDMIRKMAGAMLQTLGYEVEAVSKGEEAFERYKQAKESNLPFKAVILDLTIPGGMGGKQTLQELLAYDPEVLAIVSSGYSNDPVLANCQDYGFKGRVAKPYRIEDLSKILKNLIKSELPGSKS